MRLKNATIRLQLVGLAFLSACQPRQDSAAQAGVISDNEVRTYIEKELRPYLTALAKEACTVRAASAPKAPRYGVCLEVAKGGMALDPPYVHEGVTPPPPNGKPYPDPKPGIEPKR
jgi:hypothetical protein